MSCIFCQIANNEIKTDYIYSDKEVVAFADRFPRAPHHYLIIPRQHIATLNDLNEANYLITGHMVYAAKQIAQQLNIDEEGYRLVMNCNLNGGQTVFHIHLHLMGGRQMGWPPG